MAFGHSEILMIVAFIIGLAIALLASATVFFVLLVAGIAVVLILLLMRKVAWVLPILAGLLGLAIGRLVA
jgi:hypothetical protein